MKKLLWTLSSLALVGCGMIACDGDDTACGGDCEEGSVCVAVSGVDQCVKLDAKLTCLSATGVVAGKKLVKNDFGDINCVDDDDNYARTCNGDNDCSGATPHCNTTTHQCEAAKDAPKVYKFVRIDDKSTKATGEDPGADIDAIVLTKAADGSKAYATAWHHFVRSDNKSKADAKIYASDPDQILGEPDSLVDYGTENASCKYFKDGSNSIGTKEAPKKQCNNTAPEFCGKTEAGCENVCDMAYTFVSLGGEGGYIVVEMGDSIVAGDKLDVLELGGCKLANTASGATNDATAENMDVQISISKDLDTFHSISTNKASKGVLHIEIADAMVPAVD